MAEQRAAGDDMAPLARRAREIMAGCKSPAREFDCNPADLASYRSRMQGHAPKGGGVILAADTAVELGPPTRASVNVVIWTTAEEEVRKGRVSLIGPDLPEAADRERDFAQILLVAVKAGVETNPFELESISFWTRGLPGVMARSIPGRLWLRVSRSAAAAGLDFTVLGAALAEAYQERVPAALGLECIFAASNRDDVERFAALAAEARIYAGRHKKIALDPTGAYECAELECEACDEKPVCDRIREVAAIRRKRKRSGS